MIQILHRYTKAVIFEGEYPSIREAVEAAVAANVSLRGASLTGADFREADFREADFRGANFCWADLSGAKFAEAYLTGADFNGAEGIVSFGPCPGAGRIGYVVAGEKEYTVLLGSFSGTIEEATAAIKKKYPDERGRAYIGLILAAAQVLHCQARSEVTK